MEVAAAVSSLALAPLMGVPAVQGVSKLLKSISPEYRLERWAIKIETVVSAVAAKSDMIPSEAMSVFLGIVEKYIEARLQYEAQVRSGKAGWFSNQELNKVHSARARSVLAQGLELSMLADMKKECALTHKDRPRTAQGECSGNFPDNYIATQYQAQFPDAVAPLTWDFLLKSALDLSNRGTDEGNSRVVEHPATAPAMTMNQDDSTEQAEEEVNNPKPAGEIVGNEEVPELSIPLDEEERQILGALVGYGLPSSIKISDLSEGLEDDQSDDAICPANVPA